MDATSDDESEDIYLLGYYTTYACNSYSYPDCMITKYSKTADFIYFRGFSISGSSNNLCNKVRMSIDRQLYVVGYSQLATNDATLYKIDSQSGNLQWARKFDSGYDDFGYGVAIQPDGGVIYITGQFYGVTDNGIPNAFLIKVDDYGTQLYFRMWGVYSYEEMYAIDLSLMGKYIYMAGGADTLYDGTEQTDWNAVLLKMRYDGTWEYGFYEGEPNIHE